MGETNILPNFGIKNPLKFIIYMAGVILIVSMFVPMQGYTLSIVQHDTLLILIWGVVLWCVRDIFWSIEEHYEYQKDEKGIMFMTGLIYFIQALYIAIAIIILAT